MWPFKRLVRSQDGSASDDPAGIPQKEPVEHPVFLAQSSELAATAPLAPDPSGPVQLPQKMTEESSPPEEPLGEEPSFVRESPPDTSSDVEGPVQEPPPAAPIPHVPERPQRWLPPAMSAQALQRLRETGRMVPFTPFPGASSGRFVTVRRAMPSPQAPVHPGDPPKPARLVASPVPSVPVLSPAEQTRVGRNVPMLPFSRATSTRPPSVQRPVWNQRREVVSSSPTVQINRHRPGG